MSTTIEATRPGVRMAAGPSRETDGAIRRPERETWWEEWRLAVAAGACWLFALCAVAIDYLTSLPHSVVVALYVAAYVAGGTFATKTALVDLSHRKVNVDLLMVVAALGAAVVNAWGEGAVLLGLFSTSNALEHHALERTRHAVRALMEMSPEVATVLRSASPTGEMVVPVEELELDDIVVIRPGERVPVDGIVIDGESEVDQAAITGESIPVTKRVSNPVFAGTMNGSGAIQVRVTKLARESTLARIIGFVESARDQKSATQNFTDRFEGRYAVGVILSAALLAIVPPLLFGKDPGDSFYRAMTLLVVASPCALVISTPAATLSALANAARNGVLFKGGGYLETAGQIQTIAFDKTGTLTQGEPRLTDTVSLLPGVSEQELLRIAASAERLSEHSLAQAIVAAANADHLDLIDSASFRAHSGRGIVATLDGARVAVGKEALLEELGVPLSDGALVALDRLRSEGKTAMLVGRNAELLGIVAVADTLRPEAAPALAALREIGVSHLVMLTGDHQDVAAAIAREVGIDDLRAGLLPEEKHTVIEELLRSGTTAMVGDGVNDAPALAIASLGVAMGTGGTDVALETADVVLMADDLTKLPYAIRLGRRARRTIIQNLVFSLSVIVVLVTSALTVGIRLPLGVIGHEGSTIIVVLNGLRLLRVRP